jgi:hypothetical protein
VTNVFELVDLLPQLNVGQDQELNRFATEIRNRLCTYPAHELKKSDILRVGHRQRRHCSAGRDGHRDAAA